jgi:hypothetical protein
VSWISLRSRPWLSYKILRQAAAPFRNSDRCYSTRRGMAPFWQGRIGRWTGGCMVLDETQPTRKRRRLQPPRLQIGCRSTRGINSLPCTTSSSTFLKHPTLVPRPRSESKPCSLGGTGGFRCIPVFNRSDGTLERSFRSPQILTASQCKAIIFRATCSPFNEHRHRQTFSYRLKGHSGYDNWLS